VVHKVLEQCCAMKPPAMMKKKAAAVIAEWTVAEAAPGYAELALHWHDGLRELVPLGEYAARHEAWERRQAEQQREQRKQRERAKLQGMLDEFGDTEPMDDDAGGAAAIEFRRAAPWDENVCYVRWLAIAIKACLDRWAEDEPQRKAALEALETLRDSRAHELRTQYAADKTTAEVDKLIEADPTITQLASMMHELRRLADRHRTVRDLDASLPAADENGIRLGREEYEHKAFHDGRGIGRRYAKGDGRMDAEGKWRASHSQGMAGDVRAYLLGHENMTEHDGRASDPTIDIIMAFKLGLRKGLVQVLITYLETDETREAWHEQVAEHHGTTVKTVKRWANVLSNSGTYATCLREAKLREDDTPCQLVKRMESAMSRLRVQIVEALRKQPNALWPDSDRFWDDETERLDREHPELDDRQCFNKAFSYLRQTIEDKILAINMKAQRQACREAMGKDEHGQWCFDLLPPEQRDTAGYQFDGLMTEVREGCDRDAGNKIANAKLDEEGWHAAPWGITYQIVEKPLKSFASPDDFESTKSARVALEAAVAKYPEVAKAVEVVRVVEVVRAADAVDAADDGDDEELCSDADPSDMEGDEEDLGDGLPDNGRELLSDEAWSEDDEEASSGDGGFISSDDDVENASSESDQAISEADSATGEQRPHKRSRRSQVVESESECEGNGDGGS
jgi:hypothetical protein